jgi:hypothetical protein
MNEESNEIDNYHSMYKAAYSFASTCALSKIDENFVFTALAIINTHFCSPPLPVEHVNAIAENTIRIVNFRRENVKNQTPKQDAREKIESTTTELKTPWLEA